MQNNGIIATQKSGKAGFYLQRTQDSCRLRNTGPWFIENNLSA